jgi:hypothetical protein
VLLYGLTISRLRGIAWLSAVGVRSPSTGIWLLFAGETRLCSHHISPHITCFQNVFINSSTSSSSAAALLQSAYVLSLPPLNDLETCTITTLATPAMAFLAFLVSCLVKKDRQQCQEQDPKPFMSMTFMNKGKGAKKRKMSEVDKVDDDDVQRAVMIRKSLASRASSRTTAMDKGKGIAPLEDDDTNGIDDDSEEDIDDERNPASLKSDWKAYEADLQRNRSVLIRRHPGIDRSSASASTAPLTPISSTPSTTPTTPMTPMTTMSLPSTTSSRASPVPRQHTFPIISRKPVPSSSRTNILDGPATASVGRAATQG